MNKMTKLCGILILIGLHWSCQQEQPIQENGSFIRAIVKPAEFISRSIIAGTDGSYYLASVAKENEDESLYGVNVPFLVKFNSDGTLLWEKNLSGVVHNLWKVIALDNGNLLAVGMDSLRASQHIGLQLLNSNGEEVKKLRFFNQTIFGSASSITNGKLDVIQLRNGHIALLFFTLSVQSGNRETLHLKVFDESLNELNDVLYNPDDVIEDTGPAPNYSMMVEKENGEIIIYSNVASLGEFSEYALTVRESDYQPISFQRFFENNFNVANSIVLNKSNDVLLISAEFRLDQPPPINLRNQEKYEHSDDLYLRRLTANSLVSTISGFPGRGFIAKIKPTPDGGFVAVGTCNILFENPNQSLFRPLVVKLNQDLSIQWVRSFDTQVPTIVNDIIPSNDGYYLAATFRSLEGISNSGIIKINLNGQLIN